MKRYLAIDPGERRVGIALSDEEGVISTPHRVVDLKEESLLDVLEELVDEKNVDEIVVGYPTPLKVEENERTREVDRFIDTFVEPLSVPYELISERYSTKEADRLRSARGDSGPPADDEAAAMILEYYLGKDNRREPPDESGPVTDE